MRKGSPADRQLLSSLPNVFFQFRSCCLPVEALNENGCAMLQDRYPKTPQGSGVGQSGCGRIIDLARFSNNIRQGRKSPRENAGRSGDAAAKWPTAEAATAAGMALLKLPQDFGTHFLDPQEWDGQATRRETTMPAQAAQRREVRFGSSHRFRNNPSQGLPPMVCWAGVPATPAQSVDGVHA
jgi:hypothetical protein